jgi:hypothetical protein
MRATVTIIIKDKEIKLLANIRLDRNNKEKSSKVLTYKTGMSVFNTQRILYKYGLSLVKLTRKPGLIKAIKAARFIFAKAHQH